jgi:ribosomal protein L19
MHFLFSDIFERNKKVSYHNKQAIQSYDGVMVRRNRIKCRISTWVDRVFHRHGVKPKTVKVI